MMRARSILFTLWMWGTGAVFCLACLPVLSSREATGAVGRGWATSVLWGARTIAGVRYELRGWDRVPAGAALVAAKHSSPLETFVLMAELPSAAFVLKDELGRIPLFGRCARAAGFILVDRAAGPSAIRAMTKAGRAAAGAGQQLVIFPEGTRVQHGTEPRYLPGVAALARGLRLSILPVAHDAAACWRPGGRLAPGTVIFEVLEPLPADTPRPALMTALSEAIEGATDALYERRR